MAVFENFMEDVIIIAVRKFFSMNMCILCGEEVDMNGQFAECTTYYYEHMRSNKKKHQN